MPTFTGKFEYLIDGKKVTQEQFQNLVDGKENDYDISIDNLRVVADKKGNEPFFLDEFLFPAKIEKIWLTDTKLTAGKGVQLEEISPNYYLLKPIWQQNDTTSSVFERIQDSTLPPHPTKEQINKAFSEDIKRNVKILTGKGDKKYSLKLDCKLPDSYIKSFNSAQEKFVENLDVYNDIVGHSTRHKAGKEIKYKDIWNDDKKEAVSQAIQKDIRSQNPEQKQQVKNLSEQYKKEDLDYLKKQLLNSGLFISLEEATLIFNAETKEELQPLIDRTNPLLGESPVFNLKKSADCINEIAGKKETEGKLDYSEINFELLDLMAKRFMDNKSKYPKGNTLKQINKEDLVFAAFRHLRKMIKPIKDDPETFKDHLVAVSTNMSILLDQLNLEEND